MAALATTESKITPPRKRRNTSRKTSKGDAKKYPKGEDIDEDDELFVVDDNDIDDDDEDEDFEMEDESEKMTPVKRQTKRRTKRAIVIDDDHDHDKQPIVTKTAGARRDTGDTRKNKSENSPSKSTVSKGLCSLSIHFGRC